MEALARRLAVSLVNKSGAPESMIDKCAYGLTIIFLLAAYAIVTVCLGALTSTLPHTIAAALSAAILRNFSGGPHLTSPWRCIAFTGVAAVALGWAGAHLPVDWPLIAVVSTASFAAIVRYAPVDSPAKPIPESRRPHFLRMSLMVAALFTLLCLAFGATYPGLAGPVLSGMLWQSLSLTPAGAWVYKVTDQQIRRLSCLHREV